MHKAGGTSITATLRLKPGKKISAMLEVEIASGKGERPTVTPGDAKGRFTWAAKEAAQWDGKWPYRQTCPGAFRAGKGDAPLTIEVTFTGADGKKQTATVSVQVAQP